MAVGDEASQEGYPLVPSVGEEGLVRWGAREINRTRDFVAQVFKKIPKTKSEARAQAGITSGTADPNNAVGNDGDIYFKII